MNLYTKVAVPKNDALVKINMLEFKKYLKHIRWK